MHTSTELLSMIARHLLNSPDASVLGDVVLQDGPEMAGGVWGEWHKKADGAALRQALAELAQASAEDLEVGRQGVVKALGMKPEAAKNLETYLGAITGYVRRAFRRPSLPEGRTLPPDLDLKEPGDLLALLPPRLPWFGVGDRPWGVGDWELAELLDMNAAGEAWKAIQPRDRDAAPAALHFFLGGPAREYLKSPDSALLERILLNGRVPGVLALEQIHAHADPPCLQYAWREGGDLGSLVWEWKGTGAAPDPLGVAEIVLQIAEILGRLHQQTPLIVHRNLRPGNVSVVRGPEGKLECMVGGLGMAPALVGKVEGFDPYAEPSWAPAHAPRAADDVFALGVLWYQLLMRDLGRGRPGGLAWRRTLLGQGMPAGLLDVLETCWEDDPAERPADGQTLARELVKHVKAAREGSTPAPVVAAAAAIMEASPVEAAPGRSRGRRANLNQLFDSLERTAPERVKATTNAIGMKLVLVPEGVFVMGSPPEEPGRKPNEGPAHEVQHTKAFYLGVHLVTQEQYKRVMGVNPARFHLAQGGGLDHPVENVSWEDAAVFCRRLSDLPEEQKAGRRYRLPTEAEWEYACRAGTTGLFSFGAALAPGQANFDTTYPFGSEQTATPLQKTSPVGAYPGNTFGLHDMHGNVWEWCADWLDSGYYRVSPRRDPPGPASGQFRVIRGGSWRNHAATCRSAYRNGLAPGARDAITGFRVLLEA